MSGYVPERGDVVWLNFNPQSGHEQAAVCISPSLYNKKVGLALFCPVTSRIKGYPFEVSIPKNLKISGVVLSDQITNLDWRARNIEFIAKLPNSTVEETLKKMRTLL